LTAPELPPGLDSGTLPAYKKASKAMSTVQEIEKAIEALPIGERLRVYQHMQQLIGRDADDLDWQRLGLESFFEDDSADDSIYDNQ
jgi:hypothetical protein